MTDTYFTWSSIGTVAGCTAATTLITQFLKSVFDRLPAQILSYIVALILMVCAAFIVSGCDWQAVLIAPVNAVIVSFASNGSFDAVKKISK